MLFISDPLWEFKIDLTLNPCWEREATTSFGCGWLAKNCCKRASLVFKFSGTGSFTAEEATTGIIMLLVTPACSLAFFKLVVGDVDLTALAYPLPILDVEKPIPPNTSLPTFWTSPVFEIDTPFALPTFNAS